MNNERKDIDLIYQRARSNSVGNTKRTTVKKSKKKVKELALKKFLVKSTITVLLATSAFYSVKSCTNRAEVIGSEVSDMQDLVNRETNRTSNNEGFYYDTTDIAVGLLEHPLEFDTNLYGVYSEIGYNQVNKIEETNNVVAATYTIANGKEGCEDIDYKNFDDYLTKKGYVKEDGSIDYNKYDMDMKNKIIEEHQQENNQGKSM